VVGAAQRLGAAVEQRVRGDHFGDGQAGAHLLAQLAERTIRDAGHGGDEQIVAKLKPQIPWACEGAGKTGEAAHFTRVGA
jgi:hypothetical protein